jgi:hypothetical protein
MLRYALLFLLFLLCSSGGLGRANALLTWGGNASGKLGDHTLADHPSAKPAFYVSDIEHPVTWLSGADGAVPLS